MVWRWYSGVANTVVENSCVFFQFLNAVVTVSSDDPQSRLAVDRHAADPLGLVALMPGAVTQATGPLSGGITFC